MALTIFKFHSNLFTNLVVKNVSKPSVFNSVSSFHSSSPLFSLPSAHRNRFYKKVGIVQSDGKYEITLDNRKVKTPSGQTFHVFSEPLALVVANEWDAQHEKILVSSMHITSLCNTVLDNPNKLLKYDIVSHILTFLDNDTLLCREEGDSDWVTEQEKKWDPIVNWFCERYGVVIEPSTLITGPVITNEAREMIQKHLYSYNTWILHGLMFGVESVKSLLLALACVDRFITVEDAVRLSSLETEFQTRRWGRVEWAHDVDIYNVQSRFAASILFIHLLSSSTAVTQTKS